MQPRDELELILLGAALVNEKVLKSIDPSDFSKKYRSELVMSMYDGNPEPMNMLLNYLKCRPSDGENDCISRMIERLHIEADYTNTTSEFLEKFDELLRGEMDCDTLELATASLRSSRVTEAVTEIRKKINSLKGIT